jgi:hypothetical protein
MVSLLAAVAVYLFARIHPPEILLPLRAFSTDLASYQNLSGSAPSAFYTLALGLLAGACASNLSSAKFYCSTWIALALCLELSQHPIIAESISSWASSNFPNSIWVLIGPYWVRGVFDPLDLVATMLGGGIAVYLLSQFALEKNDVSDP